jgi:hypothetical protein
VKVSGKGRGVGEKRLRTQAFLALPLAIVTAC